MAWWSSRKQALVATATIVSAPATDSTDNTQNNPRRHLYRTPDEWQREVWDFYDSLGEFRQGITWKANMMSRVRLVAATRKTPDDDPQPLTSGPAADIMAELAGGIGGQAALMSGFAVYMDVPGECYMIGETKPDGTNDWYLRSIEELIASFGDGEGRYKVSMGHGRWRLLPADSLVVRVHRPHKRWHNVADSPSRACRTLMRELELINRHIQAQYLSRLASAGIIAFPEEVTFPVRPEFADAPDPFIAEWIEIAAEAIRTPGTAASVVPIPMRMPGEYIDKIKHIDFTLKLDDRIIEKRDSAMSRLAISLDMPPEALVGTGKVNHWCLDDQTEILSRDYGWIREPDVQIGDMVYSLDHETGIADWYPVTDVYRADVVDEPMVSIEGRFHSSLTTRGHRWPVIRHRFNTTDSRWEREWTTSADFADRASVKAADSQLPMKIIRGAPSASVPTESKYTDELVELVAWTFTEGSLSYRAGAAMPNKVAIYQSTLVNSDNCARIRLALTKMYGPARTDETKIGRPTKADEQRPWWREKPHHDETMFVLNKAAAKPIIEHCPHRVVSNEFIDSLTHSQLLLFIDTAVRGDGSVMGNKTRSIFQKDPRMLDAAERAGILLGMATHRYELEHEGFKTHKLHWLTFSEHPEYRPRSKNISEVSYTGKVWCPTVPPTHTVLARRKGKVFYTGQSAWLIDEQGVKIHISPTVEIVCDGITNGYLIPRLQAAGEDTSEIIVWYDASELILRPDRSAAAGDAYDRGEINGSAFRRETGFDDSDQPTEDEFKLMAQKKMVLTQPVNAPVILGQLYPDLKPPDPVAPPAADAPRPPLEGDAPPVEPPRVNPKLPDKPVPSDGPKKGAPPTPNKPTSKAPAKKAATIDPEELLVAALTHQAGLRHAVRIDLHGDWELLHPKDCTDHLFSCPVTHAMWRPIVNARPGQSGVYECWLNQHGQPVVGQKITDGDVLGMIVSTHTDERVLLTKT